VASSFAVSLVSGSAPDPAALWITILGHKLTIRPGHLNIKPTTKYIMTRIQAKPSSSIDYQYNLGAFHHKVTTKNAKAQLWFDRGLIWCYAFHHEESARCFERAIKEDSTCAMAYWGVSCFPTQSKGKNMS
jgi:hypothetical protein